jgi:hypothetical protein
MLFAAELTMRVRKRGVTAYVEKGRDLMLFAAKFSYEISLLDFILFGALRDLRIRCHACLAVMRRLDELLFLLAAEFSF